MSLTVHSVENIHIKHELVGLRAHTQSYSVIFTQTFSVPRQTTADFESTEMLG